MTDEKAYWRKRTIRIIKDLEEALIACAKWEDVLEAVDDELEDVLERLGVSH